MKGGMNFLDYPCHHIIHMSDRVAFEGGGGGWGDYENLSCKVLDLHFTDACEENE